jgi:hypothetical protein
MSFRSYRDESRKNFGKPDGNIDREDLNTGALLRIADATETIAKNYDALLRAKQFLETRRIELSAEVRAKDRRIASLRGVITRMKGGRK